MSEFIYLYRGGERPTSPEGMQKRLLMWTAWMKELGDKGHLKNPGQPLPVVCAIANLRTTIPDHMERGHTTLVPWATRREQNQG
jgi:hypothetical protein